MCFTHNDILLCIAQKLCMTLPLDPTGECATRSPTKGTHSVLAISLWRPCIQNFGTRTATWIKHVTTTNKPTNTSDRVKSVNRHKHNTAWSNDDLGVILCERQPGFSVTVEDFRHWADICSSSEVEAKIILLCTVHYLLYNSEGTQCILQQSSTFSQ